MKSTLDIILAVAPVILNSALIWILILQGRDQVRYNEQFKMHMEKMRQGFNALKNNETLSCNGDCGMNYCDENGCVERKRYLVDLPLKPTP